MTPRPSTRNPQPSIEVHIEELLLHGLPLTHSQGPAVQAAVETELARLLIEGGLTSSLQSGGAMPSLRANAIQLRAESKPAQLGQQIAQAVYGGIANVLK